MNRERNYWLNAGAALAIGLVMSSIIFGWFYSKTKKGDEAITVTGSAKKRIKSDLVNWTAGVTAEAPQLSGAYKQLSDSVPRIKQYLIGKGIDEAQMTVSSISTTTLKKHGSDGTETSEITGYSLSQRVEIKSNDVEKIAKIAREATELINQGILIES
ncbi:MAG: SIMPL domain-containing protein [Pyrinomonadaceae bacterium]